MELEAGKKQAADRQQVAEAVERMKVELKAAGSGAMVVNGEAASPMKAAAMQEQLEVVVNKLARERGMQAVKAEVLGPQLMQGVMAEGSRTTQTIKAGEIGNDRPILVVSERWYSEELQTVVMTKRTDPRTGEETFRLANVRRGEPAADLFMVPPGYEVRDDSAYFTVKQAKEE